MNRFLTLCPEILAGLSFFPCGVFMGYIINYYPLDEYMTKNYEKVKFWPLLVGILFSFITCGIINGVKIAYKQYKFIQFYFIYFGMILFYLSGILITKEDKCASVYLGAIAHGMIYVPALTYISIRVSNVSSRAIKISLCHIWYLLGFAIGASLMFVKYIGDYHLRAVFGIDFMGTTIEAPGIFLCYPAAILGMVYVLQEILQFYELFDYDYKKSLEPNFDRENNERTIFDHKKFDIHFANVNYIKVNGIDKKQNPTIIALLCSVAIGGKTQNFLFFCNAMLYMHMFTGFYQIINSSIYPVLWFGLAGIITSTILSLYVSQKCLAYITSTLQVGLSLGLILFYGFLLPESNIHIFFSITFFCFGFGYSLPDIHLTELTSLKYNEIFFAFGYLLEILFIATGQYFILLQPQQLFQDYPTYFTDKLNAFFTVALPFLLLTISFNFIKVLVPLPKTFNKTLLDIKNSIYFPDSSTAPRVIYK